MKKYEKPYSYSEEFYIEEVLAGSGIQVENVNDIANDSFKVDELF